MVLGSVAKLIGSKNGIRVFRQILADGKVVTKSFKGDLPFKTVTQTFKNGTNSREVTTNVVNHISGKATDFSKSLMHDNNIWTRIWKKSPVNSSAEKTFLERKETIDGNFQRVIDSIYKVKNDGYLLVTRVRGKQGNNIFGETNINADNWQMPGGARFTSQHVKSYYNNESFNYLGSRPYYICEGQGGIVGGNRLV